MNNRLFIIALTALSFTAITCSAQQIPTTIPYKKITWFESGAHWLRAAQSNMYGWGSTSKGDRTYDTSPQVNDDPATTAFVAMALLEAGGPLVGNPHSPNILQALEYILHAVQERPGIGSLTPLPMSPLQQQLGIQADVCMSVDFLLAMQKQLPEDERIRAATDVCFALLENVQAIHASNTPDRNMVLRHNALNTPLAVTAQYYKSAPLTTFQHALTPSTDFMSNGIRIIGGAGIALYRAASLTSTAETAPKEFDDVLRDMGIEAVYSLLTKGIEVLADGAEQKSLARKAAKRMTNECIANAMRSDSLESRDYNTWMQWRSETEAGFATTQKPNGSWSGEHCTHGPVVCTAAVLLAWHGDPCTEGWSAKR